MNAVPEVVTKAVGDLWLAVHDCDLERAALHRLIVDGDVLLLDDGTLVPADQFTATETGPDWNRVRKRIQDWQGSALAS